MNSEFPHTRDLVLIGGGHTHALVLRKWGMNPLPGVRVTVIDPAPTAAYSGMLPGFVAGHYTEDELGIDLVKLCRFAGARLIMDAVDGIDLSARSIHVPNRAPIAFDVAAIDVGITSAMPMLSGFSQNGIPAKPLTPFAKRWAAFRSSDAPKQVAVIGGGVAGCELAMAMAHALGLDGAKYEVRVVDRSQALTETSPPAREKLRAALQELGVEVLEGADVTHVAADHLVLGDGGTVASQFTVGAAGAKPHDWQATIGLDLHDGFLAVNPMLQTSDPAIFATGDCAHMTHAPRTKAGVFAVRQSPVLYDNLVAILSGGALSRYDPQSDYLKLISLGGKRALAEKWGRVVTGPLLWKWKNRIDGTFMDKFRDLPVMQGPSLPRTHAEGLGELIGDAPMCGGCGAKVGRDALRTALSQMPASARADVLSQPGDDAAILATGGVQQVITTDHLRSITDDPVLMTRIAAEHALGDIWAMGASPQAATATIILPRMSATLQARTMSEIMQTASQVLGTVGAAVVGGHSSMGQEMTIGFTLTGLCGPAPITLSGAQVGDAIILTKPLGSGVIMAAEMSGLAQGTIVAGCFDWLVQSQKDAAAILAGVHAMTDVTGFGLAGHLSGIAEASQASIEVAMSDVPLMTGALGLAQGGVASTLLSDNRAGAGEVAAPQGPLGDLMFDPQTSGGLVASIDGDAAQGVLAQLRAKGYQAAVIGRVVDGPARVVFR